MQATASTYSGDTLNITCTYKLLFCTNSVQIVVRFLCQTKSYLYVFRQSRTSAMRETNWGNSCVALVEALLQLHCRASAGAYSRTCTACKYTQHTKPAQNSNLYYMYSMHNMDNMCNTSCKHHISNMQNTITCTWHAQTSWRTTSTI